MVGHGVFYLSLVRIFDVQTYASPLIDPSPVLWYTLQSSLSKMCANGGTTKINCDSMV